MLLKVSWLELGIFTSLSKMVKSVIPAVDSYEDDILIRLQFSNDLFLPVRDSGHQVILEHQLVSQLLHDVLEQPEEVRVHS